MVLTCSLTCISEGVRLQPLMQCYAEVKNNPLDSQFSYQLLCKFFLHVRYSAWGMQSEFSISLFFKFSPIKYFKSHM
jgi:hypothetical protein